jgi:hypothetical protein
MAAKKNATPPAAPPPQEIPLGPDHPLILTALREDNPRDFLAALGLLRLLDLLWPQSIVSLAWNSAGHPVLHVNLAVPDDWIGILSRELQAVNSLEQHPFVHNKIIKVAHAEFRVAIGRALEFRNSETSFAALPSALYAAYGSQVHDTDEGKTSPSAFSFSNAQCGKELLRDIREMIAREFTPTAIFECLKDDPIGRRDAKSFRWHPGECRAAAYRAHDPGGNVKGDVCMDFPCANILAFFGLTFFPVVDATKREATLGISRTSRLGDCFTWPVWDSHLSNDAVFSILHHPFVHMDRPDGAGAASLGITGAYRCVRMKVGKAPTISLYFSPATRIS